MSTISNDCSFPMQTSQNCVLDGNVQCINHYTFPIQTWQNCAPIANVHHISHYTFIMQNSQKCVYQTQHYTSGMVSTNSTQHNTHQFTTHSYANMSKLRPCTTVHQFNTALSLPKQVKIAPITQHITLAIQTNVHYINHYTFTIQTSQNCAHQMSTVSIATHLLCKRAKIALTKQITTLLLHKKGHSAGFEPTPTDFNSVAAGHQISSLLW